MATPTDPDAPLDTEPPPLPPEPVLRTLAPALRTLESNVGLWLRTPRRHALTTPQRATLDAHVADFRRQADALDVEKPLLVVMLMGGTGVGKSTLLNALAGGPIAKSGALRPTTMDPVVYYHESVKPETLDPALRQCYLRSHDRPELAQKILVDTPDLDGNVISNREKLKNLLPVADVVLYVGSQEKYHDRLGWELFKEQRRRRAFAFVLNKWDRCLHQVPGTDGIRPDDDLLKDLTAEGFASPLLFRTDARAWVMARGEGKSVPDDRPEGEQFADLRAWLELGLTRLEIEAIKARGVGQLLGQVGDAVRAAAPPDLSTPARRTRTAWEKLLDHEASIFAGVFLTTLDPFQGEIEHHFSVEGRRRFRGIFSAWYKLVTNFSYAGVSWRNLLPGGGRPREQVQTPTRWDAAAFTAECSRVAGERTLDQRRAALVDRLLVEANQNEMPLTLLSQPTGDAARQDWRQRFDRALRESLEAAEAVWTKPTGVRRGLHLLLVNAANTLPEVAFLMAWLLILWRFFFPDKGMGLEWWHLAMPFVVVLVILVVLQLAINFLLPMRWPAIRGEFQRQLESRLRGELEGAYLHLPEEVAAAVAREREEAEALVKEIDDVAEWLRQREQAAHIGDLYGR